MKGQYKTRRISFECDISVTISYINKEYSENTDGKTACDVSTAVSAGFEYNT